MSGNRWNEIWNKRDANMDILAGAADEYTVWKELKRADGFDVSVGENPDEYYDCFYKMWVDNCESITANWPDSNTIFEVGCGAGASLYLYQKKGFSVSGIDYSARCVEIANTVLGKDTVEYMEASDMVCEPSADVVLSDSVFVYFPNEQYALLVLEKMYDKADHLILITEVYDKAYEKECIEYRRSMIEDYDKRYKGLDKLFYEKSFFERFAQEKHCKVVFSEIDNKFYWNSKYMYNVMLIKD